ncbi:MAG: ABC transporter permease [Marinifilaceae bacterium]
MFDIDNINEILIALRKNRLRTFLTMLGVTFGILVLVLLMGLGKGFENKLDSSLGNFATNSAFFWPMKTTVPYKGMPTNRRYAFSIKDLADIKRNIQEVEYIAPQVRAWEGSSDNTIWHDKKGNFKIFGMSPDLYKINPVKVLAGRFVNNKDLKNSAKVCLIGPRVKEVLFDKDQDPIGEQIRINGISFMIIGSFKPISNNMGNKDNAILTPYTTLQSLLNRGDKIYSFVATAKKGFKMSAVQEKIDNLLSRNHKLSPNDKEAIGSFNVEEIFEKMSSFFIAIQFFLWFIGASTLITGIIGVSNIMLIIVKEKTKEIGIKRALGATPKDIIKQILTESVMITSIAGFMGFLLGVIIVEIISILIANSPGSGDMPILDPYVDFKVACISLITLVVLGSLAGLIPAKRAVSIRPIDALRDE